MDTRDKEGGEGGVATHNILKTKCDVLGALGALDFIHKKHRIGGCNM
jgi:hypothetical protein